MQFAFVPSNSVWLSDGELLHSSFPQSRYARLGRGRHIYISSAADSRRFIRSFPLALPLPPICLSLRFLKMGLLGRDRTNCRAGRGLRQPGTKSNSSETGLEQSENFQRQGACAWVGTPLKVTHVTSRAQQRHQRALYDILVDAHTPNLALA